MKYKPGESGNPRGRPKGAINRRSQLAQLLESHAEELISVTVGLAKNGDVNAIRLCLERLIPKIKEEHICFDLPDGDLQHISTLAKINSSVITAISSGRLSLDAGLKISSIIEGQRKHIESTEIVARVEELENIAKNIT